MESKLAEAGDVGFKDWQVWLITPEEVEFWQGAKDRNHDRLKYKRTEGGWERTTLWP
jgi:pyridoxamine 5'-phosphate oxidase